MKTLKSIMHIVALLALLGVFVALLVASLTADDYTESVKGCVFDCAEGL